MMTVHSISDAFSGKECEKIINATKAYPANEALLVGHNRDYNLRRAELVWLDDVEGMGWVMDRLIDLVRTSNRERFGFDLREFAESPQVARYNAADNGHFAWHADIGDGLSASKRKLTMVIQLNNTGDYDGGDLEILPGTHTVSASRYQGSASVFPSFLLHRVTPVLHGERNSLTVWAHGPAFR